jgi:hypothetical protein
MIEYGERIRSIRMPPHGIHVVHLFRQHCSTGAAWTFCSAIFDDFEAATGDQPLCKACETASTRRTPKRLLP